VGLACAVHRGPALNRPRARVRFSGAGLLFLGMTLPGADLSGMRADEAQWNYVIDYIRIWRPAP